MRANLAQKEPSCLAEWERFGLYERMVLQSAGRNKYVLHDGPPYANGSIHIGHALNKILKDVIVRSKIMSGYAASFVPGWDCHGLPIEHAVLKALKAKAPGGNLSGVTPLEIRHFCRDSANRFFDIQRSEFKRLGILGDWNHPYLTHDPLYEATIVRELGKIVAHGGLYRKKRPVLWCPHDETALAEAEVEYADHASPSLYAAFEVMEDPHHVLPGTSCAFIIWTTTPWTLVANQAIALHPECEYQAVEVNAGTPQVWILAKARLSACMATFGMTQYQVLETYKGCDLENILCRSPFIPREQGRTWTSRVILGHHVTWDVGTGCVHTAPGHGQEDYIAGAHYDLPVFAPVDSRGCFTDEVHDALSDLKHMFVFTANDAIVQKLAAQHTLIHRETLTHAYPHCWRCKNPLIFRATEQWFVSMSENQLRKRALYAIAQDIRFMPAWGGERLSGMIENRPDWCISRQRVWGVPIVFFTCADCKTVLITQTVIEHVAHLIEKEGSDIWFSKTVSELLPEGTHCQQCGGSQWTQGRDILDVWFESGVSHAAVLRRHPHLAWPADLYLEGSDQHRGWFQSSLLASLAAAPEGTAPYRAVLTHGFTVDGAGKKMSKSAGNVIVPQAIIEKYGAEILRLWVVATDFREEIRVSNDILVQLSEAYKKIRNTCRFLLGNLYDYDPAGPPALFEIDRYMLHRLDVLNQGVQQAYADFMFHAVFHALNRFCTVELSAFYLDILKDRLYVGAQEARRAAQSVLLEILLTLIRLMAPIFVFTAEEVWKALPARLRSEESVHLLMFLPSQNRYPELAEPWGRLIELRDTALRALERARQEKRIGNALEASVTLTVPPDLFHFLTQKANFLSALLIVSEVHLVEGTSNGIEVAPARGKKCQRCWLCHIDVGQHPVHPGLCPRCIGVIHV